MEYLWMLLVAAAVVTGAVLANRWMTTWLRNQHEIGLKGHDLKQAEMMVKLAERQAQQHLDAAVEAEQVERLKASLCLQAAEDRARAEFVEQLQDDRVAAERAVIEADVAARVGLAIEFARRHHEAQLLRAALPSAKQAKKLRKLFESYLVAMDEYESQTLTPLTFDQFVRVLRTPWSQLV